MSPRRLTVIAVLTIVIVAFGFWEYPSLREEPELKEVQQTFVGRSRAEAYRRLATMGLAPLAWNGSLNDGGGFGLPWPNEGNVAISFDHIPRQGYGCGNTALVVLHFNGDKVTSLESGVRHWPCL